MTSLRRVELAGCFPLPIPAPQAFPLFTAKGEQAWVPGWKPTFVYPRDGSLELNQVFLTGDPEDRTIWSVIELRPEEHTVEYARVTPSSRVARVRVQVRSTQEGCSVEVSYIVTALRASANEEVDAFAAGFEAMLVEWQEHLGHHLSKD